MTDTTTPALPTAPLPLARWSLNATSHPSINDPTAWIPYRYTPSLAAAIIFSILFFLTTAYHTYQMVRYRAWFWLPFVIGGLMEFVGYIGRALSSRDVWDLSDFIVQSTLLLVAPAFLAASVYMSLRRIVVVTRGERWCFLPSRWISRIFVIGDCLSFLVQASGAGIQASGTPGLGQTLIMVGLGLQVAFFAFFMVAIVTFHVRAGRVLPSVVAGTNINWVRFIYVLYVASILILVRSVFRLTEYGGGNDGYLMRHEFWLYISDALLMFGVMAVMNVWHPGVIKADLKKLNSVSRSGSGDVESFQGELTEMTPMRKA